MFIILFSDLKIYILILCHGIVLIFCFERQFPSLFDGEIEIVVVHDCS